MGLTESDTTEATEHKWPHASRMKGLSRMAGLFNGLIHCSNPMPGIH